MFKFSCLRFGQCPAWGHPFHSTDSAAFRNSIKYTCNWVAVPVFFLSRQLWKGFCSIQASSCWWKKIPVKFNNAVGNGHSRSAAIARPLPLVLLLVATKTSPAAGKGIHGHHFPFANPLQISAQLPDRFRLVHLKHEQRKQICSKNSSCYCEMMVGASQMDLVSGYWWASKDLWVRPVDLSFSPSNRGFLWSRILNPKLQINGQR